MSAAHSAPLRTNTPLCPSFWSRRRNSEDRDAVGRELQALRWVFQELHRVRPGQFYLCEEVDTDQDVGDLRTRRWGRGVFQTFDEVLDYLRREEKERNSSPDIYTIPPWYCFSVEKWAPGSAGIEELAGLDFYYVDGAFRPTMLHDLWNEPLCPDRAYPDDWRGGHLEIPLPFRCGDLIRLDPPVLKKPAYAVLYIQNLPVLNRYNREMWFLYLKDGFLADAMQSHHPIGDYSEWRLIDWAHPAEPSELTPGQEILAEISSALHEAARDRGEAEAWQVFSCLSGSSIYHKSPLTAAELLKEYELKKS